VRVGRRAIVETDAIAPAVDDRERRLGKRVDNSTSIVDAVDARERRKRDRATSIERADMFEVVERGRRAKWTMGGAREGGDGFRAGRDDAETTRG
jgi:hypothetical protein